MVRSMIVLDGFTAASTQIEKPGDVTMYLFSRCTYSHLQMHNVFLTPDLAPTTKHFLYNITQVAKLGGGQQD